MKIIFIIFGLILLLSSCSSEDSITTDEREFKIWLENHRVPSSKSLLNFDYSSIEIEDSKFNIVMHELINDTLVLWFYSNQPVGCLIIGDVRITDENVELQFNQACNPFDDGIITEEADLKFEYKIANGKELSNKSFSINEDAKLINE